ncbi:MAG TPA: histidine kinase [Luteolibacter sp.]|nr:histidine kinase [Luteolibacter sp.]
MVELMIGKPHPLRSLSCAALAALCGLQAGQAAAPAATETKQHPIERLARLTNPRLARIEDRVMWLDRQLATLAKPSQFPLAYSLGYRGARSEENAPDPTVILDLGREFDIQHIYLVPTQSERLDDPGIFPLRFTIESSNHKDFRDARMVMRTLEPAQQPAKGSPMRILPDDCRARYLRLTVQQGHTRGAIDLFGLSEIFVISGGEPISFGAEVIAPGGLDIGNIWHPSALVDGRTPLGIWHHGMPENQPPGDVVLTHNDNDTVIWQADLLADSPLDRIVLFPYQVRRSQEISIFPQALRIELAGSDGAAAEAAVEWHNPIPGTNHLTPLVFNLQGRKARSIRVVATAPWSMGSRRMHAFSEIEAWSGGRNLLAGVPLNRIQPNSAPVIVHALTDGHSSENKIAPVGVWLEQLIQRGRMEQELAGLRGVYVELASRSETNVTWACAILLGLTFLIPVYIFERRRMQTREHLDIIRKRIASDLHDDIGSNLGSISLIARTARKDLARLKGPAAIDADLGEVEMIARESSLAMRDIVWLLERKQDSIGDLAHRMRETAGRLLRETEFTMECNCSRTTARLTLDAKRHLFLFYKETIHNIVKHSKATRVAIRFYDEGDKLALEVSDNGVGLPVNRDRITVSVKKLEERADVLKGVLQVTSSPESGTRIRLVVKRAHLTTQPKTT